MPMLHDAASPGRASASRWASVFDSDSSENLRPVFIPVACDYAHALGECSGCEHGPLRRYQLLCRPSGLISVLEESTLSIRPSTACSSFCASVWPPSGGELCPTGRGA